MTPCNPSTASSSTEVSSRHCDCLSAWDAPSSRLMTVTERRRSLSSATAIGDGSLAVPLTSLDARFSSTRLRLPWSASRHRALRARNRTSGRSHPPALGRSASPWRRVQSPTTVRWDEHVVADRRQAAVRSIARKRQRHLARTTAAVARGLDPGRIPATARDAAARAHRTRLRSDRAFPRAPTLSATTQCADGRGRSRAAARVRQRGQSAPRSGDRAGTGARRALGARCVAMAGRPPAPPGISAAHLRWISNRLARGPLGGAGAGGAAFDAELSSDAGALTRLARARRHVDAWSDHDARLRDGGGTESQHRRSW